MDTAIMFGEMGGGLPLIEHRGKKFQSHLLTQSRKARFINFLKKRDMDDLALVRESLGVEEYEARKREYFERCDRGDYSFYGPVAQKALTRLPQIDESGQVTQLPDMDAIAMFAACIFDCSPEEGMVLLAERAGEVSPIIARVLHESMPNLKPLESADPNG